MPTTFTDWRSSWRARKPWAAQDPHSRDARCGSRNEAVDADWRGLRLSGERCMAISVAVLVGDVARHVVPLLSKHAPNL
ncbi:MAG: hypothetical protein IPF65_13555 [Polaromonas sp.]|nr:hypothetical protein [Polaromonas sp.]